MKGMEIAWPLLEIIVLGRFRIYRNRGCRCIVQSIGIIFNADEAPAPSGPDVRGVVCGRDYPVVLRMRMGMASMSSPSER